MLKGENWKQNEKLDIIDEGKRINNILVQNYNVWRNLKKSMRKIMRNELNVEANIGVRET